MFDLLQDVRYTVRGLAKRPLFTLVAVLSMAIGIGANTTIFSVLNGLLLRTPAGVGSAERVVEIGRTRDGRDFDTFSYAEVQGMRELGGPFEAVAGYRAVFLSLSAGAGGERVMGFATSSSYFDALGTTPLLGRFFAAEEAATPGRDAVVVLTYDFWRERMAADSAIIGRTISLNRQPFTVIGVGRPKFNGHIAVVHPDVFIPLTMMPVAQPGFDALDQRYASWLMAVGRLRAGASVAQANSALRGLFDRYRADDADYYARRSARVEPLSSVPAAGRAPMAVFLTLIMGLVGMILLVTCANVAGMLIARAAGREREIAIRLALGSGRRRLVRQLVIESLVLFAAGGVAGVTLGVWGAAALGAVQLPSPVPLHIDFHADARVLLFGMGAAVLTGIVFGLAPALHATRPELVALLRNDSARAGSAGSRLRRMFVGGQVALTVVILLSAGLFLRALQRASAIDTGFSAAGVSVVSLDLSLDGYDEERGRAFQARLLERLGRTTGVRAVGMASDLPLDMSISETGVWPEGWSSDPEQRSMSTAFAYTDGGYFRALRIALVRGRVFDASDQPTSEPVVVVSHAFAQQAWPGADAIGRRVRVSEDTTRVVVGVVGDVKNQFLMEATQPMMYLPAGQVYRAELSLVVQSVRSRAETAGLLRTVLRAEDPRLSFGPVQSLAEFNALGVLPQRMAAFATVAFGVMALLLSALGVYGVIAYMVAHRTREIGVRIALGADRGSVVRLVVRQGVRIALPGALFGMLAGLGLGLLMRRFILGVAPADPVAVAGAPLVLLAAVLLACWLPAARAASVEPVQALRAE